MQGSIFRRFAGIALAAFALQAQPNAYVVNTAGNSVTVVNTATATIRGTIPVGLAPARAAASPDGSLAYVSNSGSSNLSVLDAASLGVVATIPTLGGPGAVAVSPNGQRLFVGVAGGTVQVFETATRSAVGSFSTGGAVTDIVFTPGGDKAYVAAGVISAVDTATLAVTPTSLAATHLAIQPAGGRLYASGPGGVLWIDTATNTLIRAIAAAESPGAIALTPDGSRLYVGVLGSTISTVYGTFFVPGKSVNVLETKGHTLIASIGLASTPGRIAVTPNRADVYVLVPTGSVAIAGVNTNRVRATLAAGPGVAALAMQPDPNGGVVPYLIDAVNDTAAAVSVSNSAGTPIANVLVNDTLGGARATLNDVTLSQVSSTSSGITLNLATGAVEVVPGVSAGPHSLVYQICETASPANCDQATVSLTVRDPYVIDAVADSATSNTGKTAISSVLANDRLGAGPATTANVQLSLISTSHSGLVLNLSTGAVIVSAGTPIGTQSLTYRICERASPSNCDEAAVTVEVIPYIVDAVNDAGSVTRSGGTAVANILANDKFGTGPATVSNVRITLLSGAAGVTLNTATGAVTVAAGTAVGVSTLSYRICEIANLSNCDGATVTVTVNPYLIDAVNDSARGSSKVANTPQASVLWNDTLGGARATVATVRISLVSIYPANSKIRLDVTDGSVDVLGKTESGLYSIVYRICEIANPSNCDQATVSLDLSGGL